MTKPFEPDWVSPPGDTILHILQEKHMSEEEFAVKMDLTMENTKKLLCSSVTINENIAEKLSSVLGSTKRFWLRRDEQYRFDCKRLGKTT